VITVPKHYRQTDGETDRHTTMTRTLPGGFTAREYKLRDLDN